MYSSVYEEDLMEIISGGQLDELIGSCVLITGATGLIGSMFLRALLEMNKGLLNPIKIIAIVRNEDKAKKMFDINSNLTYIVGNVCDTIPQDMGVDYIIHGASQTSSKAFVSEPVETTLTAFLGTKNMLDMAVQNKVKGFIYMSTMEVYGAPETDEKITETHNTNLNTMNPRSCYPEGKRMCENLCASYASEYSVPAKVIRLTQTFGPGVDYNDGRVFAEFARCAIEGRNIVLNTKGETKRSYLYVADAVSAILTVLIKGEPGNAYNAANEKTYCSIYEMAKLVARNCSQEDINIEIRESDTTALGYAPVLKMNLDTYKLKDLGWESSVDLVDMYKRMIQNMIYITNN